MTYELACEVIVAVNDRDQKAAERAFAGLSRPALRSLAVMLAAMVSTEAHAPAAVLRARTVHVEMAEQSEPESSDFADVVDYIAARGGVPIADIFGRSQQADCLEARQLLCWVAHRCLGMSYSAIGRRVHRDHTSVITAVKRVESTSPLRTKAAVVVSALGFDERQVAG